MSNESWTVMAYLAGDNNLTDYGIFSLKEMKEVGSDSRINIFAQFDPQDEFLPTQRYRLRKRGNPTGARASSDDDKSPGVSDDIIDMVQDSQFKQESSVFEFITPENNQAPGETDTGSPKTLEDFIAFCIEDKPADRFMVVLSGHGAGAEENFLLKDESPGGHLTTRELKEVFQFVNDKKVKIVPAELIAGKSLDEPVIDILGMDCCLMSMAEICYELRGLVNIMVSSESYSPAAGWPYRPILERLRKDSSNGVYIEKIASGIIEEYITDYIDYSLGGLSVDLSAMRVREIEGLKARVYVLAQEMKEELKKKGSKKAGAFKDMLVLAHWEAQSYNGETFADLFDFCFCLKKRCKQPKVVKACNDVMNHIRRKLVIRSCFSGPAYQFSNGVSIYFPWSSVVPYYKELDFAKDSGWADFLEVYVEETRRKPLQKQPSGIRLEAGTSEARPFRMSSGRMSSGKGTGNPIRSMRNPPIVPVLNKLERACKPPVQTERQRKN